MSDERFDLSVTTPWILLSIIAYVIAALLNFLFVIPNMRKAAATATGDAVAGSSGKPAGYAAISAGSGVVSLLLVVVVVLMVWKP